MSITNAELEELVDSDANGAVYFLRREREKLMALLKEIIDDECIDPLIVELADSDILVRINEAIENWTPEPAFAEAES